MPYRPLRKLVPVLCPECGEIKNLGRGLSYHLATVHGKRYRDYDTTTLKRAEAPDD